MGTLLSVKPINTSPALTDWFASVKADLDVVRVPGTNLLALLDGSTGTFAGKTFDLGANTLTGSLVEFNAALQSDTFMTVAGGTFTGDISIGAFLNISREDLVISGDAVTATKSYIRVDGESAAADDLDTVNGGSASDLLIITSKSSARDITVKDGANMKLAGDCILANVNDSLTLIKVSSTVWIELSRSINIPP